MIAQNAAALAETESGDSAIRKGYADTPMGQVHYYIGGLDRASLQPPLICLHHIPESGAIFHEFMKRVGRSRPVIAFDLPGYGNSDRPPAPPRIEDYAAWIGAAIDNMSATEKLPATVDVLGTLTGAFVAAELAITRPDRTRKVILVSAPILTAEERARWTDSLDATREWAAVRADGQHLVDRWQSRVNTRDQRQSLEMYMDSFVDSLKSGDAFWWGEQAALNYSAEQRFPLIASETLLVLLNNVMKTPAERTETLIPDSQMIRLDSVGQAAFKTSPTELAEVISNFLEN